MFKNAPRYQIGELLMMPTVRRESDTYLTETKPLYVLAIRHVKVDNKTGFSVFEYVIGEYSLLINNDAGLNNWQPEWYLEKYLCKTRTEAYVKATEMAKKAQLQFKLERKKEKWSNLFSWWSRNWKKLKQTKSGNKFS